MDSDDVPIIVNEEALTEAFVPTRLFHREVRSENLRPSRSQMYSNPTSTREPINFQVE